MGVLTNDPSLPSHNPNATVFNTHDVLSLEATVRSVIIDSGCCNEHDMTVLDLSPMKNVTTLEIGDYSLCCVKSVVLVGLDCLESVTIGVNAFKAKGGSFTLKQCRALKEVRIGRYSFINYSVCEIDDVPSLTTLEIGDLHPIEESLCFKSASLELKSRVW